MKSLIPVVMSGASARRPPRPACSASLTLSWHPRVTTGIIAVYGLVVSVLIAGMLSPKEDYSLFAGFVHLGSGLACGLTGLAAGYAIGIVGDAVRSPGAPSALIALHGR